MAHQKLQVLLALREMAYAAPLAQAFVREDVAVSVTPLQQGIDGLLERLRLSTPALLVLELDQNATVLEQVRPRFPDLPVVAVLERPTAQMALTASRLGAEDVLPLPLEDGAAERLGPVLEKAAAQAMLSASAAHADVSPPATTPLPGRTGNSSAQSPEVPELIGSSPRMAEVRNLIARVAGTDATVLVRGESGVGKEIVARMVYAASNRAQRPFVKVNCAAIPNDLLESELFGYEAGAFTGAVRQKPGKFELADTGTLFLDEIGEMHPMLQAKLLHVLQDGHFSRLGAKRDMSVNVRVICATNKLLEQRVAEGLFREDLFYRINVVTIHVPPLRERRDEVPQLARYFLEKFAAEYHRPMRYFGPEVEQQMLAYRWPGNVRELENLCKRFVIVGNETQILRELSQPRALPAVTEQPAASAISAEASMPLAMPGPAMVKRDGKRPAAKGQTGAIGAGPSLLEIGRRAAWNAEQEAIHAMLVQTHWNRREAAVRLRVSYKALLNKLQRMKKEEVDGKKGQREKTTE